MPRKLQQPLADKDHINKLLKRAREKTDSLGDICRFDVQNLEIPPETLHKLLKEHKLEGWEPADIRKKTAARKAITRIRATLEDPENDLRVIVRPVHTQETDVVRYAIIDETVDEDNADLDFTTRNQVIFRKDTGTIEFTKDTVDSIIAEFEYLCSVYTDPEVTLMVKNIVGNHGCVWLKDGSGMFFMPFEMRDTVDSLVGLFEEFREIQVAKTGKPSRTYFRPIAIMNDPENRKVMGEALISEIKEELHEANAALDNAANEGTKRSIAPALSRFNIANNKAKLYRDILEINIKDIEGEVKVAEARAAELIKELAKADD